MNLLDENKILVNILTRTSNRPNYFANNRESVLSQTYKNVNHIVSCDNRNDLGYVKREGYDELIYFDDISKLELKEKYGTIRPKSGVNQLLPNLYINRMLENVKEGWILILDDDDTFTDENSLQRIVDGIEDGVYMVFWRMQHMNGRIIPNDQNFHGQPALNDMGSPCFMIHSRLKHLFRWDSWSGSDHRALMKVWNETSKKKLINEVLVKINIEGKGKRVDISKNFMYPEVTVVITSYNRKEMIQTMLDQLYNEKTKYSFKIILIDDASLDPFYEVENIQKLYKKLIYLRNSKNNGRIGFWKTITSLLQEAKKHQSKYVIHLSDDFELCNNYINTVINYFKLYEHDYNILKCYLPPHHNKTNWELEHWVDGMVVFNKNFLEKIDYRIDPIPLHRFKKPKVSTGVWQQVSNKIKKLDEKVKNPPFSFTKHIGNEFSTLFNCKRDDIEFNKLETINFQKSFIVKKLQNFKISANLATYPARKNIIEHTIDSIYDQVDVLRIYLNEYSEIPDFCKRKKIVPFFGENLRSSGKFFNALNANEYYFSIDDDLEYPPSYVKDMLTTLNKYDDKIVVTLHGKILHDNKLKYFNGGRIKDRFHCLHQVEKDHFIHILGGGVSAFNTNNVRIDFRKFKYNYMDDIEVSVQLQEQNIPILLMKHPANYLKYNKSSETLFNLYLSNDQTHTTVLNSVNKWKIWKI